MIRTYPTSKTEEFYEALLSRDRRYVGIFYVGVKTTSVFCISTCRARKPLKKNVEFYKSYKDALESGYRPCKICCPTEQSHDVPNDIQQAISLVKENPQEKVTDEYLRELDISPDKVRRWFKKNYGLTFHAFQRMYRINDAFKAVKDGKSATDIAFGSGYESLSGFNSAYKKLIGLSPSKSDERSIVLINRISTPLGAMFACSTDQGICLLQFADSESFDRSLKQLQRQNNTEVLIGDSAHLKLLKRELNQYFRGASMSFTVPLDFKSTDYSQMIWTAINKIPYATSSTIREISAELNGNKTELEIRQAISENNLLILIPCHRVLHQDEGDLCDSENSERQKWLREHERHHFKLTVYND